MLYSQTNQVTIPVLSQIWREKKGNAGNQYKNLKSDLYKITSEPSALNLKEVSECDVAQTC